MTDGGRQRRRLTATVTDLEVRQQRAFLIAVFDDDREEQQRSLAELALLTETAGSDPIESELVRRPLPDPATFIGRGKAAELAAVTGSLDIDVVVFDNSLSPAQQRNLQEIFECDVVDREALILDIFAQHATSREGMLQVELALLRYHLPRLRGQGTRLSRQAGGIGTRGPGETKLESDRRRILSRISKLERDLRMLDSTRATQRKARRKSDLAQVALVGYTNAGKSTLFNRLTGASVGAENLLFATLDPTVRRLELPDGTEVVLADTVGFVRDLPHELIAAFRSTLQEAREADLILHLIDASDPNRWARVRQVNSVLKQLDADRVPQIRVYNKIDLIGRSPRVTKNREGEGRAVWVSAVTGDGIPLLLEAISDRLRRKTLHRLIHLQPSQGRLRSRLFELGAVLHEQTEDDGGWTLELEMPEQDLQRFIKRENVDPELLEPLPVMKPVATANS